MAQQVSTPGPGLNWATRLGPGQSSQLMALVQQLMTQPRAGPEAGSHGLTRDAVTGHSETWHRPPRPNRVGTRQVWPECRWTWRRVRTRLKRTALELGAAVGCRDWATRRTGSGRRGLRRVTLGGGRRAALSPACSRRYSEWPVGAWPRLAVKIRPVPGAARSKALQTAAQPRGARLIGRFVQSTWGGAARGHVGCGMLRIFYAAALVVP